MFFCRLFLSLNVGCSKPSFKFLLFSAISLRLLHVSLILSVLLEFLQDSFSFANILAYSPGSIEFRSAFFIDQSRKLHVNFLPSLRFHFSCDILALFNELSYDIQYSKSSSFCGWILFLFSIFPVLAVNRRECTLII